MRSARPLLVVVFAAAALLALAGARVGPAEAVPTELFFSEYIEGTSNNKALEIFNGTGAPVNLTAGGYVVSMYFNGATTPADDRQLERHHRARRRLRACAELRRTSDSATRPTRRAAQAGTTATTRSRSAEAPRRASRRWT